MLPHSRHGFYCHSSLPDDLGIQYQSYAQDDVVAEDEYVRVLPGLGHTGSSYNYCFSFYYCFTYLLAYIPTNIHFEFILS